MSDTPPPEANHPQPSTDDTATRAFVEHRDLLFSMAYSLLGNVADTEDVLQETWLSWAARTQAPDAAPVDNPRAYLVRVAINQALARQAALDRRRETYVGPWLPAPLVTTEDAAAHTEHAETVSLALLVVLETLSPLERTVFLLHEVFGYPHTEIAEILDRSPAAVRQLAHRAREHVHARRPRFRADPHLLRQLTQRFVGAALGGDLETLLDLLAPDVTFWSDADGQIPKAALRPVHGADRVARAFLGLGSHPPEGLHIRDGWANGDPSALLYVGHAPFAVVVCDLTQEGDRIHDIYVIGAPEKLAHLRPHQETQKGRTP